MLDPLWATVAGSGFLPKNGSVTAGRNALLGRKPTHLGGASIASGYTPPALAGALPRHPLPLKGRKSAVQKEARHAEFATQ